MGWKLALFGGLTVTLIGSSPVSKTYYSDHVHIKFIPRIMFMNDADKQEEYLKRVEYSRHDAYARVLYARNYHRWVWRKPLCTVVGDHINSNCEQPPLDSEKITE